MANSDKNLCFVMQGFGERAEFGSGKTFNLEHAAMNASDFALAPDLLG